ncbi:MAG: GrpB-like predicted nucleotidyltransferase (UPF0157 family) [Gammaproteobacteria bacterium]
MEELATPDVAIVEYRSVWVDEFKVLAKSIRDVVGDSALRIDHIGSTSIQGLAAKDVIDIQITVDQLADSDCVSLLSAAGFVYRNDVTNDLLVGVDKSSIELQKHFFAEQPESRRANIHIREAGRINQIYPLLFRDYVREDEVIKDAYEAIKRELANRFCNDIEAYYAIKDPYMDTVFRASQLWSETVQWEPDDNYI